MRVKTIVYLDHTAKLGGGEIALLNLVVALNRTRYRPVVVLASAGPLVEKLRAVGVETVIDPLDPSVLETRKDSISPKSLLQIGRAWACLRYTIRLARLIKRLDADLVHTNSLKADLYGGVAGRLAGIPVIWHVRDSIDSHYLPPLVAAAFRQLARILPKAIIANSESTLRTLGSRPRQMTATVYSGVAGGSPPGPPAARKPPAQVDGEPRQQVVHDGYDARAFDSAEQDSLANVDLRSRPSSGPQRLRFAPPPSAETKPAVIALVGRIAGWKGQHIFIEAAAIVLQRFPEACFQIIGAPLFGEQEYEQSLHQMVEVQNLTGRVVFLGFREDVPTLLSKAAIVVHASTLGEPFGQVVIEGMAAGKPVIATDGGALPEIVLPGETGLLVPMGDAPAMAEAILTLLDDPALAARMGAAGRRRVREKFTIAQTAAKVEGLYASLLGPPADPALREPTAKQPG